MAFDLYEADEGGLYVAKKIQESMFFVINGVNDHGLRLVGRLTLRDDGVIEVMDATRVVVHDSGIEIHNCKGQMFGSNVSGVGNHFAYGALKEDEEKAVVGTPIRRIVIGKEVHNGD